MDDSMLKRKRKKEIEMLLKASGRKPVKLEGMLKDQKEKETKIPSKNQGSKKFGRLERRWQS